MLTDASHQLFTRPNDESYSSLKAIEQYLQYRQDRTVRKGVSTKDISFGLDGNRVKVYTPDQEIGIDLNHWSFSQLCQMAKAPSGFLNELRPELTAQILNERKVRYADDQASFLLEIVKGGCVLRSVQSTKYAMVPDLSICRIVKEQAEEEHSMIPGGHLAGKTGHGVSSDIAQALGIRVSSGLYAGERDIFLFMISPKKVKIMDENFYVGFFVSNSEVKDGCLTYTNFVCDGVCANHLIWGEKHVGKTRWVHRGDPNRILNEFSYKLHWHLNQLTTDEVLTKLDALISKAKTTVFELDEHRVTNRLHRFGATLDVARGAVGYSRDRYGEMDWNSVWAIATGVTFISQTRWNQDERTEIDQVAANIIETVKD